jgi:6-phospho-beta-glucosidase
MRHLDESIPMKYGVIGQETQGPGGFFMALRSIQVMKGIVADLAQVSPKAIIFNYTNPINIVSQAVTRHTDATIYSLCEGPILSAQQVAVAADLEPDKVTATTIGLNHASWSIKHDYDGQALIPLLQSAYQRKRQDASVDVHTRRLLQVAATMESIPPADYFQYYLFKDEVFEEMARKPTTRAQDIMASVPGYWDHYTEQAQQALPQLDPKRSRGGIFELELALDLIDAVFNDTKEVLPVNLPNRGAIQDLPDDCVVEAPAYAERRGVTLLTVGQLPRPVAGLIKMLAEYQSLAADAAWYGTRKDAIRALSANPLLASLDKAEAIYDELAAAQSDYLPERLLH